MSDSQPDGYLAAPSDGTGKSVLVLHAWWGLNDTIKALCDRLAGAGFVAFAPDLYHGKVADTIPGAEALVGTLDDEQATADVIAAARYLTGRSAGSSIAVMGFSMGAFYALDFSIAEPDLVHAVVVFYGAGPTDYSGSKAAYLGHFAENDTYEDAEYIAAVEQGIKDAGRPVTFHQYPGTDHWFFEPDRTDAYNEAAAALAWDRTLAFLQG